MSNTQSELLALLERIAYALEAQNEKLDGIIAAIYTSNN